MEENKEEGISKLVKEFEASRKLMKSDFYPKYQLAKARLKAELEVKGRGTRRLTHEQVNLVHSIGVNFVNSVYFKSPYANFTARENEDHKKVENTEVAFNDWIKDNKVKTVVKRVIWDAYLGGMGAVFIDYEYDDVENENAPIMGQVETINEMGQAVIEEVQETDEQGNPLFERIELKNEITIQRIRPDLLRFPDGFDVFNYQESPWLGFECIHDIDFIKTNEAWDKEAREKIEGQSYSKLASSHEKKNETKGSESKYALICYKIEKPKNALGSYKMTIFHTDCEKPLQVVDFNKGHVGYPMHFLAFNPTDDESPYPNGDPWNFESQSNAVDEWWRKMVGHVKRSNAKIIYDSGAVEAPEAQKLKSNNDNEVVGLKNVQKRNLRDLVHAMDMPVVNPDFHRLYETARQMISEISPRSAISRGAEDAKTDTATEAKIMQAGEMIDTDARIDDVAEFIKCIALDVAGILQDSYIGTMNLRKEDDSGDAYYEDSIDGFTRNINIDVDVESMQSQNKDVLRKHLLEALQLIGNLNPLIMQSGKQIEPLWWLERLMDTMNIRNIEKGFSDLQPVMPVDPMGSGLPPVEEVPSGEMPPEAIEAGAAQVI